MSRPLPRWGVASLLGVTQIMAWGSSYYLPSVLAGPIAADTGWPASWIMGGLSAGLLVSGLVSPLVGREIEHRGGRPVLAIGALLLAAGLSALAAAPGLPWFLLAWLLIGAGMGAGLYDPAFATLGRLYGESARPLITGTTLFGGFASTVAWPLSAVLVAHLGWRGTCATYAAGQVAVALPLYLLGLPREAARPKLPRAARTGRAPPGGALLFALIAASFTLSSVVMTLVAVHLLVILTQGGLQLEEAVALGTLIGPAQVLARVLELALGRRIHPVWTMLVALLLTAAGLALLVPGLLAPGLVIYGAGAGIRSIVRGTLPLALYGRHGYAALMGRLAMPTLVAQAATPAAGALLLETWGPHAALVTIAAAAAANVGLVLLLIVLCRPARRVPDGAA